MPKTSSQLKDKTHILRDQLINVFVHFGEANPEIPAQILMAALGELLVQFSISQVGPNMTQTFLDHLKEAVELNSNLH